MALRRALQAVVAIALLLSLGAAAWIGRDLLAPADTTPPPTGSDPALVARGAYLARIGHCAGCHTAPGGAAYAGGRGIATPFGTVFGSNLTPDPVHGIGTWSADAFWRAMHQGRSRDGRLLVPVFPYTHLTHVSRADSDAIHAWLRSLPPVPQANQPHTLRFPYNTQVALAVWRALYFRPGDGQPPADSDTRSATWQRGAYLVRSLGHCGACHAQRNALGATGDALSLGGGLMVEEGWYAPSLETDTEAGVAGWPREEVVALLTTGISRRGSVQGPMAEVVHGSTQHLTPADAAAMAEFLQTVSAPATALAPPRATASAPEDPPAAGTVLALRARGEQLYRDHCSDCHGSDGQGVAGAYPALSGNRAVLMDPAINLVQVVTHGGFPPATAGNPRPYGMPPYGLVLNHTDIAALLTYLRSAWGHRAAAVTPLQVQRWREGSDAAR